MKCLKCGHKAKSFSLDSCTACGHGVTAVASRDGISDQEISKAVERISDKNRLYFLPSQLLYELKRVLDRRNQSKKSNSKFYYAYSLLMAIHIYVTLSTPYLLAASAALLAWWIYTKLSIRYPQDPKKLMTDFLRTNKNSYLIDTHDPGLAKKISKSVLPIQEPLQQVIICESNKFAIFLLRNEIHLLAGCPIVGPLGNKDPFFPGLMIQLRQQAGQAGGNKIKIFIVHNCTPAGREFVTRVKQEWFAGVPIDFIDMGLNKEQQPLFTTSELPQKYIAGSGYASGQGHVSGAELSMIAPVVMLSLTTVSLDSAAAFAIPAMVAGASASSGYE